MSKHDVFRNGKVHVCKSMCATCIFRPGNLMHLRDGRVDQMVADATNSDSTIICHSTLSGRNAACYGFFKQHPTQILQVAERLGFVKFVDV